MSEQQFDIVFRGDIVFGQSLVDVKARLAQLFKADAAKIDSLFTGRPIPLKRGLDLVSAQKYKDTLLKAGAQVDLVAASTPMVAKTELPVKAPTVEHSNAESGNSISANEKAEAKVETEAATPVWTLAPVGSLLLQANEKRSEVVRELDVSEYSLSPEGGFLLEQSERKTDAAPSVVVPNLVVAEVGADLVRAEEKLELPLIEVDAGDWDIAELGADLLLASEKPQTTPWPIAELQVGLAPVGAELGQLKPQIKAVVPDTSGLSLVN